MCFTTHIFLSKVEGMSPAILAIEMSDLIFKMIGGVKFEEVRAEAKAMKLSRKSVIVGLMGTTLPHFSFGRTSGINVEQDRGCRMRPRSKVNEWRLCKIERLEEESSIIQSNLHLSTIHIGALPNAKVCFLPITAINNLVPLDRTNLELFHSLQNVFPHRHALQGSPCHHSAFIATTHEP